jgi:hypothetical protein
VSHRFSALSLPAAVALLSAFTLLFALAAGGFEYLRGGVVSVAAVAAAGFTCWVASVSSLVLSGAWRHSSKAITGILAGVMVRMSLPLGVALLAQMTAGPLARAGLFGWIVCFFLVTLLVETSLLVWLLNSPRPAVSPVNKGS